ncbi:DUF2129 domain-containing protein [Candidatus Xianfuyuplasma coldseepsis]|uniref:DUF2129 domain-containing protein n=1 Tax=Candidatus Xianfuyuplasma coldseepsis TaxID=2782163 RepID=A0A7L7KSE8_9MOLU|nr:DUF2129 domain-containing protein [Xianfuyuplasma coldseepsis]QMS85525.1 DUF2129 domain-containing protein [Xianfuyuplasma coldseepsis]
MVKRKSLIVHFRSPKVVKQIERFASVSYYHKKRRYAVCYVNEADMEMVMAKLKKLKLVKKVEESLFETDEYTIDFNVK